MVALLQRLDRHAGAVGHVGPGLQPRQTLQLADDDVRVCWAEHADNPLWALLPTLCHGEGGRWASVREWSRVEIRLGGSKCTALMCGGSKPMDQPCGVLLTKFQDDMGINNFFCNSLNVQYRRKHTIFLCTTTQKQGAKARPDRHMCNFILWSFIFG